MSRTCREVHVAHVIPVPVLVKPRKADVDDLQFEHIG